MRRGFVRFAMVVFAVAGVAAACGGTTSSGDQTEGATGTPAGFGGGGVGGSGETEYLVEGHGGAHRWATGGSGGGCTPITFAVELTPLNLIFIVDRSSSMVDTDDAAELRWIPVQEGLVAFLNQPASRWADASLEFFPAAGDLATACEAINYESPTVPLLSLAALTPEISPFQLALGFTTPSGGTSTLPALLGSLDYARNVQTDTPVSTTVVVLVTGGLPGFWNSQTGELEPGCVEPLENTIAGVVEVAAEGLADGIPTHVIAVDDASELGPLDEVALAGGTHAATFIESEDAATMAVRLQEELAAICAQYRPCTVEIPQIEEVSGTLVDYDELAVVVVVDDVPTVLEQTLDCETEGGYQFMSGNSNIPSHIELCRETCQAVHATADVEISVEFPCGSLLP